MHVPSIGDETAQRRPRLALADPASPPSGGDGLDVSRAYDDHGAVMFGFAINALRDRQLAEDCVQDAFLRAWRSRDSYHPGRGSERTWLFAILRNVMADALRAQPGLRGGESLDAAELEGVQIDADPSERLGLLEALSCLTASHREVIVAVHLQGVGYAELAERLGVPVATLRTRAFYALKAMREHLDGQEDRSA